MWVVDDDDPRSLRNGSDTALVRASTVVAVVRLEDRRRRPRTRWAPIDAFSNTVSCVRTGPGAGRMRWVGAWF
jgi:hypothetical protein